MRSWNMRFLGTLLMLHAGTLLAAMDLKVTASPALVLPGERIEYSLTVTNTGTAALTGVRLESLFSGFVTVSEANLADIGEGGDCPGTGCNPGERITWDLSGQPLPAHSSRTVRYEAVVQGGASAPAEGTILNTQVDLFSDSADITVNKEVTTTLVEGLELSLTADRDPVVPGETLVYTLNFGNRGTANQLNTLLSIPVPVGTSYVADSASEGGSLVSGAVEWDLGTVLAGTSGERHFTVTVDGGISSGDAIQAGAQLLNSQTQALRVAAEEITTLASATPVQLFTTSNPKPAAPGERIEYTLTVTNTSAAPVTGVILKSLFAEGVSVSKLNLIDTGEGGDCPGTGCNPGERLSWDLSGQPLSAHSSRTVRYEAVVLGGNQAPADGSIVSSRTLLRYDGGAGSARDHVRIEQTPELELTLAADRDPVVPGEALTYVLNFGNRGTTNQLNTLLRVPVPPGTVFLSSPGGSVVDGAIQWDLGTLLAGDSGERHFSVAVDGGASSGDAIQAGAQLVSDKNSQYAEESTALASATPVQLFTSSNPKPAAPGERIEYTLTVTNTSAAPVTGVILKSLFAEGVSVSKLNLIDTGEGGDCPGTGCNPGERLSWDLSGQPLSAHSSRTVRYEAVVLGGNQAPADGSIVSSRTSLRYDGGAGLTRDDVRIDSEPKLKLSVASDRNPVAPGQQVAYRMVFGNQTSGVAKNLKLTVPIPPGTTLFSASPGATRAGDVLSWDLRDSMLAGATDEYSFSVRVDQGTVSGDALVVAARLVDTITSLTRAESVTSTAIQQLPDIRLSVTATSKPQVEGTIVYRLTVTNNTPQSVSGIRIRSLFPEYMNVSNASISDGGSCPGVGCNAGERITWDFNVQPLAGNASRTVLFDAVLRTANQAPPDGSVLSNQASISYDSSSGSAFGSAGIHTAIGTDIDVDRDSLPDTWEMSNFNSLNFGPGGDPDGDGLTNRNEYLAGADPKDADSDGDTMPDGYEFDHGLNPVTAADANEDLDGDGFTNLEEFKAGTDPSNDADAPTFLKGTIKTDTGEDVCALVLASGRFMFSCNPNGVFSIVGLPREQNGTFKRQIYADGFFPKVVVLPDSVDEDVVMTRSGVCPKYNPPASPGFFPDAAGKRLNISGKVLLQDSQTPICAMVLANGKFMFTCDGTGNYALNIPLDANGQFKLQVYADGFAPTIQVFDKQAPANEVRMARASECQTP